ncbi:MAG: ABC transporter ATP-binding protein [Candidatus Marinimicrobia bacterium]|nr:ABC transporter ATP-binding protein [Candidatus Neomarinimicrobiota bacterium]
MSKSLYTRMLKLVANYWYYLVGSTLAAFLFVAFNSASIWLTASLLNNILIDFDKVLEYTRTLETAHDLSMNDQLKYWTNSLIIQDTALETLKMLCFYLLGIFVLKNLFLYIKNILLTFVQYRLITELRDKLYAHFHILSLSYFNQMKSGELTSIILTDVANMRRALSSSFQKLFVEPINILTFVALMFIINPKLTIVALIIVPVSGMAIFAIGRSMRRKSRRTAIKIAGITNIITETLTSIRVVKAFTMEKYEVTRFSLETNKFFNLIYKRAKLRHLATPITESLGVAIGVALLWIGGKDVLVSHSITPEDFIRFVLLMFSIMGPLRQLSNVNIELQTGMASAERVFNVLDTPSEIQEKPDAITKTSFDDKIEFHDVHFNYNEGNSPVLNGISFSINKGDIVALVGSSGAGKSTIADLIPRFYDITRGSITIDGLDIRDMTINSLRNLMGTVTQETILFNDTVLANIAYGLKDVSVDDVRDAAMAAHAIDFIEAMPQKWETLIGDNGVMLSGGQRQRMAIARALQKNPPILILDEATSSLDTKSELLVQQAIENLLHDRTVLIIAHRLSTIQNADKIIVLEKGQIAQVGTHEHLLGQEGLYKYLYDIQFKNTRHS